MPKPKDQPGAGKSGSTRGSEADSRIGARLGKYQITGKLGKGGMGEVYEAQDSFLKRKVAIKILCPEVAGNRDALRRFVREARAAAVLNHPNVVTIFEVDQRDGLCYLVMEMIRGGSAEDRLRSSGAFPWSEATRVIAEVCRGLKSAHDKKLIHRDIKPANIMISREGTVKIADFGLAKSLSVDSSLTKTGAVIGTPHYMSPEQCRGEVLDARSDIYSLGATYYTLLVGKPPFRGDGPVQVLFAHCSDPIPDPRTLRPDVPQGCVMIARKAMAKTPAERYADTSEMLNDLEALLAPTETIPVLSIVEPPTMHSPTKDPTTVVKASTPTHAPSEAPTTIMELPKRRRSRWLIALGIFLLLLVINAIKNPPPKKEAKDAPLPNDSNTKSIGGKDDSSVTPAVVDKKNSDDKSKSSPVPGERKRVLIVLPHEKFWYPDYGPVRRVLDESGVKVSIASTEMSNTVPDESDPPGEPVKPDLLIADARVADFDAVVFIGGVGVRDYLGVNKGGPAAQKLIRDMLKAEKHVAAICTAPPILADAGVLEGREATCSDILPGARNVLKAKGVKFRDEPVVVSGKIITGRNENAAKEFAQTLLREMNKPGK